MKNITNMFAASGYFESLGVLPLPSVLYVSAPLATGIKGALMIALVENLWYELNSGKLDTLKQQTEECLSYC